MFWEIFLSLVILALVFGVLLPALFEALRYLVIAVVYVAAVLAALAITALVVLTLFFEPNEVNQLARDAVAYLNATWFWLKTRWT